MLNTVGENITRNKDKMSEQASYGQESSQAQQNGRKTGESSMEAELLSLRQRLADIEAENQALYHQNYQLRERLASTYNNEKERSEFISNVAHELRSPLTSIKGYVDLLLEGDAGQLNDLQNEFLCVVGANTDKLAHIISDLLDVSRLEAGRLSFNPGPTDLRVLIAQAAETIQPQLEAKQINFEISLPDPKLMLEVNADRDRFLQAVKVLLNNAGRYTPQSGKVALQLHVSDDHREAQIRVTDESPSIHEHEISRVFTKFWQPDDPAWRENGSPGLSLAIVKAIVEMHGGRVEVITLPGTGNLFTITLPLLITSSLSHRNETGVDAYKEQAVLVVTTNPAFGSMAEKLLIEGGFQVLIAEESPDLSSGGLAWKPDLILEEVGEVPTIPSSIIATVPTLQLQLSKIEQHSIELGALGVLPWPALDNMFVEYFTQALNGFVSLEELDSFKKNGTVLIVSPQSSNLRALDKVLHDAKFERVFRALQEYDALTLAQRHNPGCLVIDLTLKDEVNFKLLEELKTDPLLINTPTVVLVPTDYISQPTAPDYQPKKDSSDKFDSRVYTNLIPKPFIRRRFLNIVRRLANGT
jgi:signal transduction histidine kinase/CheY-like chemotaxis protein